MLSYFDAFVSIKKPSVAMDILNNKKNKKDYKQITQKAVVKSALNYIASCNGNAIFLQENVQAKWVKLQKRFLDIQYNYKKYN